MAPNFAWLADDVTGTCDDLTAKLHELEGQDYEIFTVTTMIFPNAHGWTVVARKKPAETKPVPEESTREHREIFARHKR